MAALPVLDLDDLVDPAPPEAVAALAARKPADPAEPLEILCTSGSTGNPKGVTVNQSMLLASTVRCLATIPAGGNRFVSILPLSHIMEQVAGLVYAVAAGAETEYITTLRPDVIAAAIKGHRATALVVVPQVLELLFNAIRREADRSGSGATFRRALRIAPYLPISMRRRLFKKVHAALGGELRMVMCSAAHLPPTLQRSWEALGVEVVQGYGSTEAGLVTANFLGRHTAQPRRLGDAAHGAAGGAGRRGGRAGPVRLRGLLAGPGLDRGRLHRGRLVPHRRLRRRGRLGGAAADRPDAVPDRPAQRDERPPRGRRRGADRGGPRRARRLRGGAREDRDDVPPGGGLRGSGAGRARGGGRAVKAANRKLAPHQRVVAQAPFPEPDFPRTHTRKVQRSVVAERMRAVAGIADHFGAPGSLRLGRARPLPTTQMLS